MGGIARFILRDGCLWLLMWLQKCYAEGAIYIPLLLQVFFLLLELGSRLVRLFSSSLDYVHNSAGVVGAIISTTVSASKTQWKRNKVRPRGCKSINTTVNTVRYL